MDHDPVAPKSIPDATEVDPGRAWILGLAVEPDGSLSGPGQPLEWLSCECPDDCCIDHENA